MSTDMPGRRLAALAEEARGRASRFQTGRERHRFQPPQLGDLFVVPESGEAPLEWALLERRPEPAEGFVAVPADSVPLVGSGDVEVPPGAPAAPLTLRCHHTVILDKYLLASDRRTGTLEPGLITRALEMRRAIENRTYVASPLAEEVDQDPEYRDWIEEVITPARTRLLERASRERPPGTERVPRRTWALAATVLIALGLGTAGGLLWQRDHVRLLEEDRQRAERALAVERGQREQELSAERERHRRELTERERQAEEERRRDREQIAALERRLEETGRVDPLVNVPFAYLAPRDPTRGEPMGLTVPQEASYLFLVLQVLDTRPFQDLRLEIVRRDTGARVWSRNGLIRNKTNEVRLALPLELLPVGEYRLHLFGLEGGTVEPMGEYELKIKP